MMEEVTLSGLNGSIDGSVESGEGYVVFIPGRTIMFPLEGFAFLFNSRLSTSMALIHVFLIYTDSALNS